MSTYSDLPIVILGGSFGGISCAHHIYNQALKELRDADPTFTYRVILVSPSRHLYWNISAPRALVSPTLITHAQNFTPLAKGFEQYDPSRFEFVLGLATRVNTRAATVTVCCASSSQTGATSPIDRRHSYPSTLSAASSPSRRISQCESTTDRTIRYHALIIATGTASHSDLFSLHGPHIYTQEALDAFHAKLPHAETVVIGGGGASGVETAGQIAYYYNVRRSIPDAGRQATRKSKPPPLAKKRIILYSSTATLLPSTNPKHGRTAKRQLESMGVEVHTGVRVTSSSHSSATGFTTLHLTRSFHSDDDMASSKPTDLSQLTDLYVPCTGVSPNTSFLPDALLDMNGYVRTARDHNSDSTLRVLVPPHMLPQDRKSGRQSGTMSDRDSAGAKRISIYSALGARDSISSPSRSRRTSMPPYSPTFASTLSATSQTEFQAQGLDASRPGPRPVSDDFRLSGLFGDDGSFVQHTPGNASALKALTGEDDSETPSKPLLNPPVYAIGDVADYSHDCIQDVYAAMSVLEQNFICDLLGYQLVIASGIDPANINTEEDESLEKVRSRREKWAEKEKKEQLLVDLEHLHADSMAYRRDNRQSILIPVGGHLPSVYLPRALHIGQESKFYLEQDATQDSKRSSQLDPRKDLTSPSRPTDDLTLSPPSPPPTKPSSSSKPLWFTSALLRSTWKPGGVGSLMGKPVPAFVVWLLKGRTYRVGEAERVVRQGVSPYPYQEGERRGGVGKGGRSGRAGLG